MRRVAMSRVLAAPPARVRDRLTPRAVIEGEGRYLVDGVEHDGDRTVVHVEPTGRILLAQYVFEDRHDGFIYRRTGEGQTPVSAETTVRLTPEGEGTRVDVACEVSTAFPLPLVGRIVARQRRAAIRRLCGRLDAIVA